MVKLELKDYSAIKYMLRKYPGYCLNQDQADRIYEWADQKSMEEHESV